MDRCIECGNRIIDIGDHATTCSPCQDYVDQLPWGWTDNATEQGVSVGALAGRITDVQRHLSEVVLQVASIGTMPALAQLLGEADAKLGQAFALSVLVEVPSE